MGQPSLTAFNLQQWIDEHRDRLKPPVCNQQVFDEDDFIVMVVGGPNARDDYHIDEGPEFFYQLEGEMLLKTMQDGRRVELPIRAGEVLLLPPRVPHSPQRFADSVGLVVERKRLDHELDGFVWYCDNCDNKLYEEFLYVSDIVGQLPPLFDRFYGSREHRRCDRCGHVKPRP
ncbi:MAG: 3-hydroxyanthranilate 3,4-dioxygenase [Woeseiaceae bacterium]|nr:3-hydroxyanthranilate 3,4-dioxygenase [Woeseiaceae bacterium]